MKQIQSSFSISLIAGFSLFMMFFGAGNLVFPISIGSVSQSGYLASFLGFFITGIIVPFTGVFSMILTKGDRDSYFNKIGKYPALILLIIIMCLMGPFGAIPRGIIVSFSGAQLLCESMTLPIYSALFCISAGFVIWNHHYLIDIISKWFGPAFILALIAIIVTGFINAPEIAPTSSVPAIKLENDFNHAFAIGNQTMDLLAAVFFAMTTIEYIYNRCNNNSSLVHKISISSCIIGGSILAIVYFCFMYLGSHYHEILQDKAPEQMLMAIAVHTLGSLARPIVGFTLIVTCFTTVVVLVMLFAEFIGEKINIRLLNRHVMIVLTLVASFAMSLLGFETIMIALASILEVIYPALISLAIGNILNIVFNKEHLSTYIFYVTLLVVLTNKLF